MENRVRFLRNCHPIFHEQSVFFRRMSPENTGLDFISPSADGEIRSARTPPPLGWTGAKGKTQGGQRPAGFALSRREAEGQRRVVRRDILEAPKPPLQPG